jgi:hypothetical protein
MENVPAIAKTTAARSRAALFVRFGGLAGQLFSKIFAEEA